MICPLAARKVSSSVIDKQKNLNKSCFRSPVRFSECGVEAAPVMSAVYKERFPNAKGQMEYRLQQFIVNNAPLSGFNTSLPLDVPRPTSRAGSPTGPQPAQGEPIIRSCGEAD